MDSFKVEVFPWCEVANVPPKVGVLRAAPVRVGPLDKIDCWVRTCQVPLKGCTWLILSDIDKVRGDAGIVRV